MLQVQIHVDFVFFSGLVEKGLLAFLQSVSGLKKVCLQVSDLTTFGPKILSLIQVCPSLIELR